MCLTKSLGRETTTICASLNRRILVVQLQAQAGHEISLQGLGNHCEEATVEYFQTATMNIVRTPSAGCFVFRKIIAGGRDIRQG